MARDARRCARLGHCLVLIGVLLASRPGRASSATSVVVFGETGAPARETFVQALAIELVGRASVVQGPELSGGGMPERIDSAVRELAARDATLGVWIDTASADQRSYVLVLYAVGRRRDLAVVKVARVQVAEGDDVDRALALKVGDFLDELVAGRATIVVPRAVQAVAARTPALAKTPPARSRVEPNLGLGAAVASGSAGTQVAFSGELGVVLGGAGVVVEPMLEVRLPSDLSGQTFAGTASASERDLGVGLSTLIGSARRGAGVHVGGVARVLETEGTARDGMHGAARRVVPVVELGAEVRWPIEAQLAVRAAAGVEVAAIDEHFTIDGQTVLAAGRVRATATVSLVIPLR